MREAPSQRILTKIGLAVLVIALLDLFFLNYLTFKNQKESQESQVIEEDSRVIVEPSPPPIEVTEDQPEPSSAPPPAGGTTETKTIVEKETVVQTAQKEIFIPIGSGSVQKKDWTDVPGLEVTIDTTKYSVIESIVFEATVWPEGGNGRAYARLINISDSNPFVESQISSASNTGELKTSGSIPFPSGSKKYGVQAKSDIENFGAHVENARIKITLK